MAFAVKWQIDHWKGDLHPGDIILSNSPGTSCFTRPSYPCADVYFPL
jgi:N-methylhydantoinase B/oxoprolinase/acetone carboxylase alpha subunit